MICEKCIHYVEDTDICKEFKNKDIFVKMPCKVGAKAWCIMSDYNIVPYEVESIVITKKGLRFNLKEYKHNVEYPIELKNCTLGENFYLLRKQAKEELASMLNK